MLSYWWYNAIYRDPKTQQAFADITQAAAQTGSPITQGPLSRVIKVDLNQVAYYVKRFHKRGKHLRQYLGRSRLRAEWQNLHTFSRLGIPVPKIVAYGEAYKKLRFEQGILITEEIKNTVDLAWLDDNHSPWLTKPGWVAKWLPQVADYTRRLHQINFVHNDLKFRNVLVTLEDLPQIYFIDCPLGKRKWGPFAWRGKIKDLACLDKRAKQCLSKTQRLRFYLNYRQIHRLTPRDKKIIRRVLNFFAGRE